MPGISTREPTLRFVRGIGHEFPTLVPLPLGYLVRGSEDIRVDAHAIMTSTSCALSPVVLLPGACGAMLDVSVFKSSPLDRIEIIHYPGWRRYLAGDFSAEELIAELAAQIESLIPTGPIRIVGNSIGGHFGYAVALRLVGAGRTVNGFCAVDSFMIASDAPASDWKVRALKQAVDLLKERRFGEFARFARSKFWRAGLRLAPSLFNRLA